MSSQNRFSEMELFVQTVDLGSLSKAAEALGFSVPTASRHLSGLEKRLGARLIERNTRRSNLTGAGQAFYQRSKNLLAELDEAEAEVNATQVEPIGTLCITSSISFAKLHLAPLIPGFCMRHPAIRVKILGENRYFDILGSEIDVAIRTREIEPDSNITIRRLAESRRVLSASPSYLKKSGIPRTIEDLSRHKVLIYSYANHPRVLDFKKGATSRSITLDPDLESNDGQILTAAALAGGGVLVQPRYIVQEYLASGQLVSVLNEWDLPRLTINIAFQTRRYMPAKTRIFIDYLIEHFREQDYERLWTS